MSKEVEFRQLKLVNEIQQGGSITLLGGRVLGQMRGIPIARRIPGKEAKSIPQGAELIMEGCARRPDAVQHDKRRAVSGLPESLPSAIAILDYPALRDRHIMSCIRLALIQVQFARRLLR